MNSIKLKNWYQLDFVLETSNIIEVQDKLKKIYLVVMKLKKKNLLDKWFFFYETPECGPSLRIRIRSRRKEELENNLDKLSKIYKLNICGKHKFEDYEESMNYFFNENVVAMFANIMSEASQLTINKLIHNNQFDNYRIWERITHCFFNTINILSPRDEIDFLFQSIRGRLIIKLIIILKRKCVQSN